MTFFCTEIDYSNNPDAIAQINLGYVYFILKVVDLLDTLFFVLRKKYNQISVLHIYHHAGMCFLGWIGMKYLCGGHTLYVVFLNSIVHTIMYSYYLLTAWDKSYKNSIWWKKHITQVQIVQFIIFFGLFTPVAFQPNCHYPKWVVYYLVPQNLVLIVLFSNFYIKAYLKPQQKKKN